MSVDLPPPYTEKSQDQLEEQNVYFVAINHNSLITVKENIPSNEEKTCHKGKLSQKSGPVEGFRFLQPVALRSLKKFFTFPGIPSCDRASSNFAYNLWYFQLNYAVLLALVVLIAIQQIRCHQFTLEVIVTAVVMGLVYCVNNLGCQAKALGRKVKLSEQFTAIITIMVLYNGLLPEAFDFIYFFGGYVVFVVIHASMIQVHKSYNPALVAPVHHI